MLYKYKMNVGNYYTIFKFSKKNLNGSHKANIQEKRISIKSLNFANIRSMKRN